MDWAGVSSRVLLAQPFIASAVPGIHQNLLIELAHSGLWPLYRREGLSHIGLGRSAMASMWYCDPQRLSTQLGKQVGVDWLWWLDADVWIEPDDLRRWIQRVIADDLEMCGLAYPRKSRASGGLNFRPLKANNVREMSGTTASLVEVESIGFGCVMIHRRVYAQTSEFVQRSHYSGSGFDINGWAWH